MSFTLRVDAEKWRAHTDRVRDLIAEASGTAPIPVIKGNGYGFGQDVLAREADRLGADTIAVGTVFEVDSVLGAGSPDIVVLEPFTPSDAAAAEAWWHLGSRAHAGRIIRTVSSIDALYALCAGEGSSRVILEVASSMHRFGLSESQLIGILRDETVHEALLRGRVLIEGISVHLPLVQPADEKPGPAGGSLKAREVMRWAGLWQEQTAVWSGHNAPSATVWVSHVDDAEARQISSALDEAVLRVRVGTKLWLGNRSVLHPRATVLAVHPIPEGTHVGYRQRTGPRGGTLVVVSGGTSHGVGLSAPTPAASLRQRVVTAGIGALDAAGRALSPFTWAGKQRWFAEPPHQHHSMIWLPAGCVIPQVGDVLDVDVRYTTSRFDALIWD